MTYGRHDVLFLYRVQKICYSRFSFAEFCELLRLVKRDWVRAAVHEPHGWWMSVPEQDTEPWALGVLNAAACSKNIPREWVILSQLCLWLGSLTSTYSWNINAGGEIYLYWKTSRSSFAKAKQKAERNFMLNMFFYLVALKILFCITMSVTHCELRRTEKTINSVISLLSAFLYLRGCMSQPPPSACPTEKPGAQQ